MATAEQVKTLIKSHFSNDRERFYTIFLQIATHESKQGHVALDMGSTLLTVGAFTSLDEIKNPDMAGYEPTAPKDCLFPFTTKSSQWDEEWPIKPHFL